MGQDFESLRDQDNQLNRTYRTIFNPSRAGVILQVIALVLPGWLLAILPLKRNDTINGASRYIKQVCRDLIAKKRESIAEKERTDVDIISVALESGAFSECSIWNDISETDTD
jgi:hypothetical protein